MLVKTNGTLLAGWDAAPLWEQIKRNSMILHLCFLIPNSRFYRLSNNLMAPMTYVSEKDYFT